MTRAQPVILCIEDEPELLEDLALELGDNGYSVIEASDGMAGLAAILEHAPDLVLCDVQLPKLGGMDLLGQIRQSGAGHAGLPFILLTAYSDAPLKAQCEALGTTAFFVKPVDYQVLLDTIARILGRAETPA